MGTGGDELEKLKRRQAKQRVKDIKRQSRGQNLIRQSGPKPARKPAPERTPRQTPHTGSKVNPPAGSHKTEKWHPRYSTHDVRYKMRGPVPKVLLAVQIVYLIDDLYQVGNITYEEWKRMKRVARLKKFARELLKAGLRPMVTPQRKLKFLETTDLEGQLQIYEAHLADYRRRLKAREARFEAFKKSQSVISWVMDQRVWDWETGHLTGIKQTRQKVKNLETIIRMQKRLIKRCPKGTRYILDRKAPHFEAMVTSEENPFDSEEYFGMKDSSGKRYVITLPPRLHTLHHVWTDERDKAVMRHWQQEEQRRQELQEERENPMDAVAGTRT